MTHNDTTPRSTDEAARRRSMVFVVVVSAVLGLCGGWGTAVASAHGQVESIRAQVLEDIRLDETREIEFLWSQITTASTALDAADHALEQAVGAGERAYSSTEGMADDNGARAYLAHLIDQAKTPAPMETQVWVISGEESTDARSELRVLQSNIEADEELTDALTYVTKYLTSTNPTTN